MLSWIAVDHPGAPLFDATPFEIRSGEPYYRQSFASRRQTNEVHAATIHPIDAGDGIVAYWYGGTREGAADVQIYQAHFQNNEWDVPKAIVNREALQTHLHRYIRKIGNPVSFRFTDGTIWLFFVSVSMGGWAGSSINLMESGDAGETWSSARRLVTSPFLNISTLVRNPPVMYRDGTIGLPVYHEFLGKFAELLRINRAGKVLHKTRLTSGTYSLQPTIAAISPTNATALLRYAGDPPNRVMQLDTENGGRTWSPAKKIELPNPNSAIATLTTTRGIIAVLNNSPEERNDLSLAIGAEDTWMVFHQFEFADPASGDPRFSYPAITHANGNVHIAYTWNKQFIKHVTFNGAWLERQLR